MKGFQILFHEEVDASVKSIGILPPTQSTFEFQERLDGSSIGELLDFELPLKIVALAEEPAKQATKAGLFSWWMNLHMDFLWRSRGLYYIDIDMYMHEQLQIA